MTTSTSRSAAAVSLVDKAYDWLKGQILKGALPAGEVVDDREIALLLGVSRTPVRDAIMLLHHQGFLDVVPRKKTRVAFLQVSELRHIYQLLTALEVEAVHLLTCRHPGEEELAPLRRAVVAMHHATGRQDIRAWAEADECFHRGLLQGCLNPRIEKVAMEHRDISQRAHLVALQLRPLPVESVAAHTNLLELIAQGDAVAARNSHLKQRQRGENELIAVVERAGLRAL
jgi:DNA-binding GntR family transcriptional regulator